MRQWCLYAVFAVTAVMGLVFGHAVLAANVAVLDVRGLIETLSPDTDSDGDGITDLWEMSIYKTDPHKADTDGDRFNDKTEIISGNSPLGKGRLKDADYDKDGLNDRMELAFGADPTVKDSDADGFQDGNEVNTGFSPTSTLREPLEKRIRIVLSKQQMQQILGGVTMNTYLVSSGKPGMRTPVGEYTVLSKHRRAWSNMAKLWMPYWMQFTTRGHGIHELPEWPGGAKEGAYHLGRPVSHGCVRLGVGPAKAMYEWAPVGTKVTIVN